MTKLIAQDGTEYRITSPVTTIGREDCDIVLPDDDLISRRHAKIERQGDQLALVDMNSTNGTFVDGTPVQAPHTLQPGDLIQLGDSTLTVVLETKKSRPTRAMREPPDMATPAQPPQRRRQPAPAYRSSAPSTSYTSKPGRVQTLAILCLVDGALNIIWAISLAGGLIVSLVGVLCVPIALYPLTLGILEIIYGAKLAANPPKVDEPAQYLAIMQIANILVGDVISLVIGILSLVFYGDPDIKAYFASLSTSGS
jgi:hypothetical protein